MEDEVNQAGPRRRRTTRGRRAGRKQVDRVARMEYRCRIEVSWAVAARRGAGAGDEEGEEEEEEEDEDDGWRRMPKVLRLLSSMGWKRRRAKRLP